MKTGATVLIPEKPKPIELPAETATLVNITDVNLGMKSRTYGMYQIRGKKKGEAYAKMVIGAARGVIDHGDNKKTYFVIKAEEIACDLARECNNDIWGIGSTVTGELASETNESSEVVRGFSGVFVCDGAEPTEEELEKAQELLQQSDATLITSGHENWDQFHRPDTIHDGFKRAARRWGVDAEWLYRVQNLPDCPHCASKLKSAKATVCATCGRDVDPQASGEGSKSQAGRKSRTKAAA